MGEVLGREPRFWGFGGLKPFSPGPRLAVGVRRLVRFSTSTPPLRPPHGMLGAHLGSTEFTPNAGRPTPGRTLASPSLPPDDYQAAQEPHRTGVLTW